MKSKPIGIIVYDGPSLLDGQPIVAIATGVFSTKSSKNDKLGNMVQIFIIKKNVPPIFSITDVCRQSKRYSDKSVCGDCKHRDLGSCYVDISKSPNEVFHAFCNNRYEYLNENNVKAFENKFVRIGAYGDPAAIPFYIWAKISVISNGITAYTHQWNNPNIDNNLKNVCMASCDTEKEYFKAKELGWRTFRIRLSDNDTVFEDEFICPASKEAGNKSECVKCLACMGLSSKIKKNPCIVIHGTKIKIDKFIKGIKKIKNKKKWKKYKNIV